MDGQVGSELGKGAVRLRGKIGENGLTGPVLLKEVTQLVAFSRRVLGVRTNIEVEPPAVAQEEVRGTTLV